MKLVAIYPTWRNPVPASYMVEPEDVEFFSDMLLRSGAVSVKVVA